MTRPTLWGNQFLLNTTIKKDQEDMKIHALKNGTFLAVWTDYSRTGGDTSDGAIRGQIFNADGSKRGGEFLINTTTVSAQSRPDVTVMEDGRFVVVWRDHSSGEGSSIRARSYQADGTASGNDVELYGSNSFHSIRPSVAALSNGNLALAFTDPDNNVMVRTFNASLQRVGADIQVDTDSIGLGNPVIVAMQGRYSVTYDGFKGNVDSVYQRSFNNDGTAVTASEIVVNNGSAPAFGSESTILSNGSSIVAWCEAGSESHTAIKAQIFNLDGSERGGEITIQTGTVVDFSSIDVTHLADGGFAISYLLDDDQSNSEALYLATFDGSGKRVSDDILVDQVYEPGTTNLSTLADGRIVVAWEEWASAFDNQDLGIHAQIVDPRQKAVSLTGTAFNDQYIGTRFNDQLKGAAGDDRLEGAEGKDTLTGDAGKDVFVFKSMLNARTNKDKITDFNVRDDSIWLDSAVFTKLGRSGSEDKPAQLKKAYFTIGDKAKDRNDYLIYDKAKGVLLYDADGSGQGKAVAIATLSKNLKMTNADFFVI
ncbi:calcium-binding protein [Microvirga arsenatis]|uniref:Uncharacterized protein n=1 Tax=Microvirga arsenatis TaxID=2692265 RepID=A0ABW9YTR2_9HYPH|nr:calcium-binding protein [Microvirga arsenatis]NBJ09983.1 hypothetical protein [Microvirga arsenatis]NBJ23051.1 hypothetical protein [Microvirga arsenatis]